MRIVLSAEFVLLLSLSFLFFFFFFASNLRSSEHSHFREKSWLMTYLVLLPLHTGLARNVTDTDCWGQNVGRDLATLKRRMLTNRTRNRAENLCVSIFYSIPIDRTREVSRFGVP